MELKQLKYFQMTSRLKNITRAAKRLSVSQPNITVSYTKNLKSRAWHSTFWSVAKNNFRLLRRHSIFKSY